MTQGEGLGHPEPRGLESILGQLDTAERAVVEATGVFTPEDLMALATAFPSIGDLVPLQQVTTQLVRGSRSLRDYAPSSKSVSERSHGAMRPVNRKLSGYDVPGRAVPIPRVGSSKKPPASGSASGAPQPSGRQPIPKSDRLRIRLEPSSWPVRHQKDRGTCVAFATVSCLEHSAPTNDLSEQFAYWTAKSNIACDSEPGTDGTWIRCATEGMQKHGVCIESLWRYDGTFLSHDITHGAPSQPARVDASGRTRSFRYHEPQFGDRGLAIRLLDWLRTRRVPVAVSLPVFEDPVTKIDNWSTSVGERFGHVLNPVPTSLMVDGHAVSVVGFEPFDAEPCGGFFIVRNSWSAIWGRNAGPNSLGFSTQPGHGYVSASYIEDHLWEMAQPD